MACLFLMAFTIINFCYISAFPLAVMQYVYIYIYIYIYIYTGCNRRNGPDFGRVFLRSNYTDIIQNTYIQS